MSRTKADTALITRLQQQLADCALVIQQLRGKPGDSRTAMALLRDTTGHRTTVPLQSDQVLFRLGPQAEVLCYVQDGRLYVNCPTGLLGVHPHAANAVHIEQRAR
jgi:predicted house-cleaning NTP pyrophosphatase (Maf/HAM1 superfamily)